MIDYPVIKLRSQQFQSYHGYQAFDYVGKEPPHYCVNVDSVTDGYVGTWTHNAHGAIILQAYTIKQFHALYELRESKTTTD